MILANHNKPQPKPNAKPKHITSTKVSAKQHKSQIEPLGKPKKSACTDASVVVREIDRKMQARKDAAHRKEQLKRQKQRVKDYNRLQSNLELLSLRQSKWVITAHPAHNVYLII
jgi:ribonuclease HI